LISTFNFLVSKFPDPSRLTGHMVLHKHLSTSTILHQFYGKTSHLISEQWILNSSISLSRFSVFLLDHIIDECCMMDSWKIRQKFTTRFILSSTLWNHS